MDLESRIAQLEWRLKYSEHIHSKKWRALRRQALDRGGWCCSDCGCTSDLEVHHKNYRRMGKPGEIDDLVALCEHCHAAYHGKAKEPKTEPVIKSQSPDRSAPHPMPNAFELLAASVILTHRSLWVHIEEFIPQLKDENLRRVLFLVRKSEDVPAVISMTRALGHEMIATCLQWLIKRSETGEAVDLYEDLRDAFQEQHLNSKMTSLQEQIEAAVRSGTNIPESLLREKIKTRNELGQLRTKRRH